NVRLVLLGGTRRRDHCRCNHQRQTKMREVALSHNCPSYPALAQSCGCNNRSHRIADCEAVAFADGKTIIFPARKSSPVSRIALSRAPQSSKSVAKIFVTIRRVSSGTSQFRITGG